MSPDELKAHGLYQCPHCKGQYPSRWAAEACCDPDYDIPRWVA